MDNNTSPGPSQPSQGATSEDTVRVPSSGLEFFEYRRRLFLAGLPAPSTPTGEPLPDFYEVPRGLPDPLPIPIRKQPSNASMARVEAALSQEGVEYSKEMWESGVRQLAEKLHEGRKFTKGMRLSLVIKILIASWINDGLWPTNTRTGLPERPPESPLIEGIELFPDGVPVKVIDTPEDQLPPKNEYRAFTQ
ncbi:hypothetical protein L198_05117 [Cryptococcus wingfieldii CBS 7118]|uniref:Uncharacterized protein n=1 Tax=Cryptococcus wingfieldii CBS 7118 TaxID=1295528 RepID=A0A1E3J2S9_9TREE|nr:hypothetical protein L198_05117 [Cryptococcus wingfieldii CBS 7118]ODN94261.1 hypothetical protein L198_05117 [Cryptococcus wingfieldii CBS 7118]